MKVVAKVADFVGLVNRVAPVAKGKLLRDGLLRVEADSACVQMSASNGYLYVVKQRKLDVLECGVVVLGAQKLLSVLRVLPLDKMMTFSVTETRCSITCGVSSYTLMLADTADFPIVPGDTFSPAFKMEGSKFREWIRGSIFAIAGDDSKYGLNGARMERWDERLRLVASDGNRLSYSEVDAVSVAVPNKMISRHGVQYLLGNLEDGEVEVEVGTTILLLKTEDGRVYIRYLEGEFPNYQEVLPKSYTFGLQVKKDVLMGAIRRVSVILQGRDEIRLRILPEKIVLYARALDVGEAEDEVDSSVVEGVVREDYKIALKPQFVLEALEAILDEDVVLSFDGTLNPVRLSGATNTDTMHIVMPIRM